jgi:hypothetical protein
MTDGELSKLHDEVNELTDGALNRSLPQWMDENMTVGQFTQYFDILEELLYTDRNSMAGLFLIHTCPHDIRLMALKQALRNTTQ